MNKLRKIAALGLALTMLAPTGVFAEDATAGIATTSATIDTTQKGSITLYKYLDNNGKTVNGEGVPLVNDPSQMADAIRNYVGDASLLPEKGVKFKLLKVADIDQVTEDTKGGTNATGTYYTNIDEDFFNIMNSYLADGNKLTASEETRDTDGRKNSDRSDIDDHYESDELNEKLMTVIRSQGTTDGKESVKGEVAINRYVRQHATSGTCIEFDPTNEYGYTTVKNLDLGLYIISEIDYEHAALSKYDNYWEVVHDGTVDPITGGQGTTEDAGNGSDNTSAGVNAGGSNYADIVSPSSPFFISVPMTNIATIDGHAPGTVWQYDITAFPKNGSLTIHKDIVTNDFHEVNGSSANDGQDTVNTETLCNMRQTNYINNADGTSIDGSNKNGLTHQIDANIGDKITQLVSADVPALTDDIDNEQAGAANRDTAERKHNAKFVITDRMTKGLQLIDHSSFLVTVSTRAWNDYANVTYTLDEGTDYSLKFADDAKSYTLELTTEGLHKLDDIKSASYLYVLYDVEVTKDALIGTDTYGSQRVVVKTPTTNGENNNKGETEDQLKNGDIGDNLVIDDSKTDTHYDSTYTTGENDETTTTVQHPEATNQNTAELTYATDRTQEHDYYSNTTKVFTYEVDLTKTFSDGTNGYISKNDTNGANGTNTSSDYSKVKFTVRGEVANGSIDSQNAQNNIITGTIKGQLSNQTVTGGNADWEQLLFIRTGDGTYRVWDKYTDGGTYDAANDHYTAVGLYDNAGDTIERDVSPVGTVTRYLVPNSETGLLTIRGLDDRKYEFTEVATAPGRNLMAEPFYLEIVAPSTPTGGLRQSEGKVENGSVAHAYVWTGDEANKQNYDVGSYAAALQRMNEGRIPFAVQNNEVIKVLKTGGKGKYMYLGVGAMALAVGGFLLAKKKKEEEAEAEA